MPREELEGQLIALEPIAGATGCHEVADIMVPPMGAWHHMVERGRAEIQSDRTVDTPLPAFAEGEGPEGLLACREAA
jgi:hypothetical protein